MTHECQFTRTKQKHTAWQKRGPWLVRGHYKTRACRVEGCGAEQQPRKGTRPVYAEEFRYPDPIPSKDHHATLLTEDLLRWKQSRRTDTVKADFLVKQFDERGSVEDLITSVQALAEAGTVHILNKPFRDLTASNLLGVRITNFQALEEMARPGARAATERAIQELAKASAPRLQRLLGYLASRNRPATSEEVRILQAFAAALDEPDFGIRTLSAMYAGDSKAFGRHKRILTDCYGPLQVNAVFRDTVLEWMGGHGVLQGPDRLDLAQHRIIGVSQAELLESGVQFPPGGVVFIENKAVFEAAALQAIPSLRGAMVLWTGGEPGRCVAHVARAAAQAGASIRVWFDLDAEGVMMARRLVATYGARPIHMDTAAFRAGSPMELKASKLPALRRALKEEDGFRPVLERMLKENSMVEQETLLPGMTQREHALV